MKASDSHMEPISGYHEWIEEIMELTEQNYTKDDAVHYSREQLADIINRIREDAFNRGLRQGIAAKSYVDSTYIPWKSGVPTARLCSGSVSCPYGSTCSAQCLSGNYQ